MPSVQRSRGFSEVLKTEKSSIVEEKTGGRISRSSRVGASVGLLGGNKSLREVAKNELNPSRWIWKGTWQGINASLIRNWEKKESRGDKTREVQNRNSIAAVDRKGGMDRRSGLRVFADSKIGERRNQFTKVP
jgi:hypothetical protein